ncbi:peptidase M75 family protein [Luteimicrobium xylanilyticum]|uniref:Efem/EfeO family lipoprotein n=1 Tax=Luteimicrobium xylanilyticum TaxID=1133546 RepID=A0A5P9Q8R4_9MICO|nr:iron uptake system protein EfeO [Luteimicrobium xylanilyticum]QFU97540.1 Efem/EfeO family lipoprotein [Luteimicrobium xylanilyticum]
MQSHPTRRTRTVRATAGLAGLAGAIALVAAGCSSSSGDTTDPSPSASGGATHVDVTLTSAGGGDACQVSTSSVPAGPVTFTVTNKDSAAITEVELLSGDRIVGEKENLAPGLAPVSFTVTLGGGKYQVYCPGAQTDTTDLTVTGEAATPTGGVQDVLAQGTKTYGTYVDGQVADMVTAVKALQAAVDSGDLEAAQKAYADARPFYEKVESDVEGFVLPGSDPTDNKGNLDYLIDMRASNLDPAVGWHGFHAVERDLFEKKAITGSTKKLAAELTKNVDQLSSLAKGLSYKPEDLANGAAGLLEEVQANKIKGEEEKYSHLDLVDFAANVEGAEQAFANLEPGLEQIDPDLTKQVATQFANVKTTLKDYEDPSALGGYKTWTPELRKADAAKLSQAIQALQQPLSKIAEKVATAQ